MAGAKLVVKAAKMAIKALKKTLKGLNGKAFKKAAKKAAKAFNNFAKNAAKKAGKAINNAGKKAGKAINNAAKKAGKAANKAAKKAFKSLFGKKKKKSKKSKKKKKSKKSKKKKKGLFRFRFLAQTKASTGVKKSSGAAKVKVVLETMLDIMSHTPWGDKLSAVETINDFIKDVSEGKRIKVADVFDLTCAINSFLPSGK